MHVYFTLGSESGPASANTGVSSKADVVGDGQLRVEGEPPTTFTLSLDKAREYI